MLGRSLNGEAELQQIESQVAALKVPASDDWIAVQISTMLAIYHTPDMPHVASTAIATLWINELEGLPAWAIEAACAFWVGRENPQRLRRWKPLPGDIAEIAEKKLNAVNLAVIACDRYREGLPPLRGAI